MGIWRQEARYSGDWIMERSRLLGFMLVDLARHVANAYEQTTGENCERVLQRIKDGFDAEWAKQTDTPNGGLERQ